MPPNKQIAIVITSLSGGGAEKVMLTLASELLSMGHRVLVVSLKPDTQYHLPDGIELIYPLKTYKGKLRSWFNSKDLAKILSQSIKNRQGSKSFDLVLYNLHEAYRLGSLCNLENSYYIIHNSYKQELKRELLMGPEKFLYMLKIIKNLDGKRLLGVSGGVTDELNQSKHFRALSAQCIYNPFNIEQVQRLAQKPQEVSYNGKYILHVGRAAKAKRHDVLFSALKHVDPAYKLVCLCSNTRKLEKLAIKLGVYDRLVLPGFTQNPYAWMKKASAVVLSSDFEGLPTVLIESLLCGTPIASTDCQHGPSEIMQGQLSQFLAKVGDAKDLAQKINLAVNFKLEASMVPILSRINARFVAEQYLALCNIDESSQI